MTAGQRRRPADVISARRKEAVREALTPPGKRPPGAGLPDTRLPLRHTANGYQMRHQDGAPVAAYTPGRAQTVPCEDCGSGRPAGEAGRHGALPVTGQRLAAVADWPRCRHGVPWWMNCRAAPVPPPCCGGAP
jgi:hypothetical protein